MRGGAFDKKNKDDAAPPDCPARKRAQVFEFPPLVPDWADVEASAEGAAVVGVFEARWR
ncbi:hypothetical protein [Rhodoblastus sp.]|uniref:hypothetical protein n=1 Tax=Rhodoblastus sp. TaxID=1962975 RepID=UPI003F97FB9E